MSWVAKQDKTVKYWSSHGFKESHAPYLAALWSSQCVILCSPAFIIAFICWIWHCKSQQVCKETCFIDRVDMYRLSLCINCCVMLCLSAGPLYLAGGGDGRHGAGDQHEWDRSPGRSAEPHGEVRGQSVSPHLKDHAGVFACFRPWTATCVNVPFLISYHRFSDRWMCCFCLQGSHNGYHSFRY